MKAKDFMLSVSQAENELKLINAKRRHYAELASGMGGYNTEPVVTRSSSGSRVESAAVALVDLTRELDARAAEFTQLIVKAEGLISKLKQEKFRQVLTYRYLAGMSWRSISDEMKYKDPKSVYRTHGFALRELQRLL